MSHSQSAITRTVALRVRAARQRRGWSAERLAEEVTRAGVRWDRYAVTNLERGRRQNITVEELLALAYVLSVAPVHLLVPTDDGQADFIVAPAVDPVPADDVRAWIRGSAPLPGQDPRVYFSEVPAVEFQDMQMTREAERNRAQFRADYPDYQPPAPGWSLRPLDEVRRDQELRTELEQRRRTARDAEGDDGSR
jgi:transcriptional regulator with XRE-family HTH domain